MKYVNIWTVQASHSYWASERYPNDSDYKRWATREALAKYWNMGKRKYTKIDAK